MKTGVVFLLGLTLLGQTSPPSYFTPSHQVSGIGVSRDDLSADLVEARTKLMIESQTFTILREPMAVSGAKRITTDRTLQSLFQLASQRSGVPASLIEAIAYLESWGDARAQSPAGPRGIMQISQATARRIGLRVSHTTRYRIVRDKVQVRDKRNRPMTRVVRRRVPYSVPGRDERLRPERAIPAAAQYLASLEQKFGGSDWGVFAYHCGEGCVTEMQELTRQARGVPKDQTTVARMFFSASPAWNRELYQAIQIQMQRDYSPTYWFRVKRAEQLLESYRSDPHAFEALAEQYKMQFAGANGIERRAPHRLSVWLKLGDLAFHTNDDIRAGMGSALVRALDRPDYFGYQLQLDPDQPEDLEYFSQASPAAIGALTYIAFETRRLWQEMKPGTEQFRPIPVTALVEPEQYAVRTGRSEALSHGTGQVFDLDYAGLPPAEYECLRFVLDDLGWDGYLGFVEEGRDTLHIGGSPDFRDFFTTIFQEALGGLSDQVKGDESTNVR